MRRLKTLINKNINTISKPDITGLFEALDQLSPYPWSPKHAIHLEKIVDVEFVARAPELVDKLANYIIYLYKEIDNLNGILKLHLEEEEDKNKE